MTISPGLLYIQLGIYTVNELLTHLTMQLLMWNLVMNLMTSTLISSQFFFFFLEFVGNPITHVHFQDLIILIPILFKV